MITNPFDKIKEKDKHEAFSQIISAIVSSVEDWMLKKYPSFDTNLDKKIEEISRLQNEFKLLINDVRNDTRNQRARDTENFKNEIEKFIKKNYPEISRSILDTAAKLKSKAKNLQEREEKLDQELSDAILKRIMKKMKKAFEDETE